MSAWHQCIFKNIKFFKLLVSNFVSLKLQLYNQYYRDSVYLSIFFSLGYQVDPDSQSIVQRVCIVMTWFCLSLLCAIFIPDIGKVIKFLGCLAAFFIFFFPASSLIANTLKSDPSLHRGKSQLLFLLSGVFLVFGAFILGCVFTQDVQQIISTPTSGYLKYYFGLADQMSCPR